MGIKVITNPIVNKGFPNGTEWTRKTYVSGSASASKIIYVKNKWWCCFYNSLYYSTNGIDWNLLSKTTAGISGNPHSIWYVGNMFFLTTSSTFGFYVSADGNSYTKIENITVTPSEIHYHNGVYVLRSNSVMYTSTDGYTFVETNLSVSNISSYYPQVTGYSDECFCTGYIGLNKGIYYLDFNDVTTWQPTNLQHGWFYSIFFNSKGIWNAGGNDRAYYSTDGKVWTQAAGGAGFQHIVEGDGLLVGVKGSPYYSTDAGKTWNACEGEKMSGNQVNLYYENGMWMAYDVYNSISSKGLYYSEDGITWSPTNIASGRVPFVSYANGIWITASDNYLYYSVDGREFIQAVYAYTPVDVQNHGGVWVANTGSGIFCSPTWQPT